MQIQDKTEAVFLSTTATVDELEAVCRKLTVKGIRSLATWPMLLKPASGFKANNDLNLVAVIGFPHGNQVIESKIAETVLALVDGADEIAYVAHSMAISNNDWQYLAKELSTFMQVARKQEKKITVIINAVNMSTENLLRCCDLFGVAGIDYLQLGISGSGELSTDIISLVRKHLADAVKLKVAVAVIDPDNILKILDAGADLIHTFNAVEIVKQFEPASKGMVFEQN